MSSSEQAFYLKVPILGHTNVGKSTLFHFFRTQTNKIFTYKANDFILVENIRYKNVTFNIQFWDAMGLKNFSKAPRVLFQKANIAIVMYDVSDMSKTTLRDVPNWINRLWNENAGNKIPFLMIGNKTDLRKAKIQTLSLFECSDLSSRYSRECNIEIPHIEVSALAKQNCEQIIPLICELFLSLDFPNQPLF